MTETAGSEPPPRLSAAALTDASSVGPIGLRVQGGACLTPEDLSYATGGDGRLDRAPRHLERQAVPGQCAWLAWRPLSTDVSGVLERGAVPTNR
ncbi:hypothetical protein MTO96_049462 [Rhipicephalus appendiculatus]